MLVKIIQAMWHWTVANAQVGITYFWLAIFAGLALMEGLGLFKISLINQTIPITMLVMSFWFQRQRESGAGKPDVPSTPAVPTSPAQPANP